MRTHSEIIRTAGIKNVCILTRRGFSTVSAWGQRDSIPSEYWAAIIGAGHATADELIEAAALRRVA